MKKVIRVISALGAGASLLWGVARTLRRGRGNTDDGGPDWPPRDAEAAARATPAPSTSVPAKAAAPAAPTPKEPGAVDPPGNIVKGVEFANGAATVAFVNSADGDALKDIGVKGNAQKLVLKTAPITTIHDLNVQGIGRRTLQALAQVG